MTYGHAALVIDCPVNHCDLLQLPTLGDVLGAVKARTFRQASRLANRERGGFPVRGYAELVESRVVVICEEPASSGRIVDALRSSGLDWRQKIALLCSRDSHSGALEGLAERGASVGSVTLVKRIEGPSFFCEGDATAVRAARWLVEAAGGTVVELAPRSQLLAAAGVEILEWMMQPSIDAAIECLRRAGLTPRRARPLVQEAVERTVRAYLKGGRRSWKPPRTDAERQLFLKQLASIREVDPRLARGVSQCARLSLIRAGHKADWLPEPAAAVGRGASG